MSGPMSRYRQIIDEIPDPISIDDIPDVKIDLRGLSAYARERGVQPVELSDEEQNMFYSVPVETLRDWWSADAR